MGACCSYQIGGSVYYGTTPKYKLEIDAGIPMSDFDFSVKLECGDQSVTVLKSEMPTDRDGNYYLCFSTTDLGVGKVKAIITAEIPDTDFSGGFRTEVFAINNLLDIKEV